MDTILDLVRTIVVVMKMTLVLLLLPAFLTWIITFLEDLLVMKSIC